MIAPLSVGFCVELKLGLGWEKRKSSENAHAALRGTQNYLMLRRMNPENGLNVK
jgi:hypothetical protein